MSLAMNWPGMGDPTKRKKTLRFLAITAIIGISSIGNEIYDFWIRLPEVDPLLQPILEIIPLQLLAYYAAVERQNNPDYPRNLAKSVTVK